MDLLSLKKITTKLRVDLYIRAKIQNSTTESSAEGTALLTIDSTTYLEKTKMASEEIDLRPHKY